MPAPDSVANITLILTFMAVGALLETVVPMFAAQASKPSRPRVNLGLTAFTFLSNWQLASVAGVTALALRPEGLMDRLGWLSWLEIVAGIVVLDFSTDMSRIGRCTSGR